MLHIYIAFFQAIRFENISWLPEEIPMTPAILMLCWLLAAGNFRQ